MTEFITDPKILRKMMTGDEYWGPKDFFIHPNGVVDIMKHPGKLTGGWVKYGFEEQLDRQFGRVNCNFKVCEVTTLYGSPYEVMGNFSLSDTTVTSLRYMPRIIHKGFECDESEITDLSEYKYALLSEIHGLVIGKDAQVDDILNSDRINGIIPSELIPGKIKQMRELS